MLIDVRYNESQKIKLCCPVGTGGGVRKSVILARVGNQREFVSVKCCNFRRGFRSCSYQRGVRNRQRQEKTFQESESPIHDPLSMKIIFNLFFVLCHTYFKDAPYWSVSAASCNFILGNSFHCRSRTASDMTCKLGITFADESKDFYVEKSGQSSCRRAKRSWLVEVRQRKRFPLDGNC